MSVGLAYDLREEYRARGFGEEETAEFDSPETIGAIEAFLRKRGFATVRIGSVHALTRRLAAGERWDFVFNIAEGMHGFAREAQVPALLEAFEVPYTFSDPLTLALTLDKGMAKRIVRDHGLPTAPFAVVESTGDTTTVPLEFPVFVKPLAEGTGKGISAASFVTSGRQLARRCQQIMECHRQPALVESYLPGREFTVGVVGNGAEARVIGVMEIVLGDAAERFGYSFENKERYEDRVEYRRVDDAESRCAADTALAAWRALRCRDGGRVDLRSDARGVPQFMEVNPLPGLHPVRSDLVILAGMHDWTFETLLAEILAAFLARTDRVVPSAKAPAVVG